jgi:polyphosphate kinase
MMVVSIQPPNNTQCENFPSSAAAQGRARSDSPCKLEIAPSLYFNRELSWLAFNERVLNEATASWPLLDRLKFLAIFFSESRRIFHDSSRRAPSSGG